MGIDPHAAGAGNQPSAPPMQTNGYPSVPPGYPPIVAPGAPVMHPGQQYPQQQQQQQRPPQGSIQPGPTPFASAQQPTPGVMHPSALPAMRPPAVHVVEQHTYMHLPDEPLITRSSCAVPRHITCPACLSATQTVVSRQSGLCAYMACFGLCWVCCPLFWLPFCLDCDKDIVHRCGACGTEVARIPPCR